MCLTSRRVTKKKDTATGFVNNAPGAAQSKKRKEKKLCSITYGTGPISDTTDSYSQPQSPARCIADQLEYDVVGLNESKGVETDEDCGLTTSHPQTISTSTPAALSASGRSRLLDSLSPESKVTDTTQLELIAAEERSLTSLLNATVENSHLITRHDEPEADDENLGMVTLVRPSMIPQETQVSPSKQIMDLQRRFLKANNRIYELETENRELTEAMKDLRIQLNITTDLLEELKNDSSKTTIPMETHRNRPHKQISKHPKVNEPELQNRFTELENVCEAKTKETQRLSTDVSDLKNKYLSAKEETDILMARLASLKDCEHALQGAHGPEPNEPHLTVLSNSDSVGQQQDQVETNSEHSRPKTFVRAFRGQSDPLSNFYNIGGNKLLYSGRYFNSSEQAYQYTKVSFHGQKKLAKEILQTTDPRTLKKLGDIRESMAWNRQKVDFLRDILVKKATCCPEFRTEVGDPNAIFVEAVQDPFWGSGMTYQETCNTRPGQWNGANVMGTLLSQIRSRLPTLPKPRPVNEAAALIDPMMTTKTNQHPNEQAKSILTIVGDSMTRNVCIKLQGAEVRKFTMSGATIEDVESRLPHIIGKTKPNTLIIHVGTNNLIQDNIENLRQKYCNLLRQAKRDCPECKILMSGIFLRADEGNLVTSVPQANELLQELCSAYSVEYLDNFLNRNKSVQSLKRDGLHLTRTGVSDLTTRLERKLQNQHPFHEPQNGPARSQEKRGVAQDIKPYTHRYTMDAHTRQLGPNMTVMTEQAHPRQNQMNYRCWMNQRPAPNPPYPSHIMPRHPVRPGNLTGGLQPNQYYTLTV